MYLKDRLYVGLLIFLITIIIFMGIMSGFINFLLGLILIIIVFVAGKIYLTLQIEKYQKENHDNLEKIANQTNNK
jgi:c-di-AMP phosphodiesterase-like protein